MISEQNSPTTYSRKLFFGYDQHLHQPFRQLVLANIIHNCIDRRHIERQFAVNRFPHHNKAILDQMLAKMCILLPLFTRLHRKIKKIRSLS